jgi:hypothetical protein
MLLLMADDAFASIVENPKILQNIHSSIQNKENSAIIAIFLVKSYDKLVKFAY